VPEKHESFSKRFFESLFSNSSYALPKDRVREYICHRLSHGAPLKEVLREDYVCRNCSEEEINQIIQDPRLVHGARANLWQLFESGELDPASARRRR
jgi:hypothetical protein